MLDAWNGYHAVELEEESRDLTAFITPFGRYRYRRAPQGQSGSGDAYTKRADEITKEVERQCKVVDDALLYDDDIKGNFFHIFDYLKLCGDNGITFNKDKFQFCQMEVEFAGFRVTADGVKPSNKILHDIENFPEPTTLKEARRWFGLIEQVAFAHSIGDTMTNFRDLVKPTCKTWSWTPTLQEEFKGAKEEIVRRVKNGVKMYSISRKTCVATDWSKLGLGFLVLQKHCKCSMEKAPRCCEEGWQIVFAGSKKCSGAESRYAPIEGEALGVAWALEKARMFTLGCPDLLVTVDHQSLIPILGDRSLADIPNPRLYRLKEKCLRFRFQIQYLPGKRNDGPDCMSRMYGDEESDEVDLEEVDTLLDIDEMSDTELGAAISACYISSIDECYVNNVGKMPEDDQAVTIPELVKEGAKDDQYQAVMKAVKEGFPEKVEECSQLIQPFYKIRRNVSVVCQDDMEFLVYHDSDMRTRLVIPKLLRSRVKMILHADHRRDLARVKMRAQEHVFWPGMSVDLKSYIDQCVQCQVNMPSHQKEPLIPTAAPIYPFQMVAADFFEVQNYHYLVYVDRYSGWNRTAYFKPGKATSAEVIKVLRQEFASMGVPEELSCDRGTNLSSREITTWLTGWGVKIRDSSARYPQSNGRAECAVKAAKKLVVGNTKSDGSLDTDRFMRACLNYRNSSIYPDTGRTIAQTLLGRHLRDALPAMKEFYQLKKEYVMERKERELLAAKLNAKHVKFFNRGSKELPELAVGDKVRIQNNTTLRPTRWDKTGEIMRILRDRQYEVMVDGSRRLTVRNRKHLRKVMDPVVGTEETLVEEGEEEDDAQDTLGEAEVVPESVPTNPIAPTNPIPAPDTAPVVPPGPGPVAEPTPTPDPILDLPRRSARTTQPPERLEVDGNKKTYADVVKVRIEKKGKFEVKTEGGTGRRIVTI